jgi:hypothetical protein
MRTRHFAELFWVNGGREITEVGSPKPTEFASQVPETVYAFCFYDIMSTETDGITLRSDRLNISPKYFIAGRVMTMREVLNELPLEKQLITNMIVGDCDVIKLPNGRFKPFKEGDVLLQQV